MIGSRSTGWFGRALVTGILSVTAMAAAAPPRRIPGETLHVNLVLLDVVVTDRKGTPVGNVPAEDFTLLVDGSSVPIAAVEPRCKTASAEEEPGAGAAHSDAAGQPRELIVLFDMAHLTSAARSAAIRATLEFVDERMTRSDRMMILAFLKGLHVVSRMTTDRDKLRDGLERLKRDTGLTSADAFEESVEIERIVDARRRSFFAHSRSGRGVALPEEYADTVECVSLGREAEFETARVLRAFANMMPAFGGVHGRKALLLFTETLRETPALPFLEACDVPVLEQQVFSDRISRPELEDLIHEANLAGVAVYAVHAGGMVPERTGAAHHSARGFQTTVSLSTGGRSFVLMNDRLAAFDQARSDLSCYHELAYRPPERLGVGRHTVQVRVEGRGRKVRYRSSFVVQRHDESSDAEMMAVLANPGLYRDLPIEAHGYSLGASPRGRRFLLEVSVPESNLVMVREGDGVERGAVSFRGAVIHAGEVQCEFSRRIEFAEPIGRSDTDRLAASVRLQSNCDLAPGEQELVVASRDETGGSLGTFWARIGVEPPAQHDGAGALLWGGGKAGVWEAASDRRGLPRPGDGAAFVREDFSLRSDQEGVITFLACSRGRSGRSRPARGEAVVELRGAVTLALPARDIEPASPASCHLMEADLPPAALPPGRYRVLPGVPSGWTIRGKPASITLRAGREG